MLKAEFLVKFDGILTAIFIRKGVECRKGGYFIDSRVKYGNVGRWKLWPLCKCAFCGKLFPVFKKFLWDFFRWI